MESYSIQHNVNTIAKIKAELANSADEEDIKAYKALQRILKVTPIALVLFLVATNAAPAEAAAARARTEVMSAVEADALGSSFLTSTGLSVRPVQTLMLSISASISLEALNTIA